MSKMLVLENGKVGNKDWESITINSKAMWKRGKFNY